MYAFDTCVWKIEADDSFGEEAEIYIGTTCERADYDASVEWDQDLKVWLDDRNYLFCPYCGKPIEVGRRNE